MSDAAEKPAEAAPKKSKKTLIIALAAVLLLGGGGGGAAWWFLGRGEPDEKALAAAAEEKRKAARLFLTLEPFVVNLADRESERYAQIGIVLEVEGKDANQKITDKMPAVRNEILLLISSKQAQDLITREGKVLLAGEIALAAARPLGWTPPKDTPGEVAEEPPPKAKGKAQDSEKAKAQDGEKTKSKDDKGKQAQAKKREPAPVPNPVAQVHFASFIVQ
jgi:flagellar FliL protein